MNLGAIQSKCEHVANAVVPPGTAKELYYLYLAKGIQATTAIEGNTLSEKEVRQRIVSKKPLPQSQEYQGKEIDNIVKACNAIAGTILGHDSDPLLTPEAIWAFNQMVLEGLPLPEEVVPGEYRAHSVVVAGYRGAPPHDCPELVERLCRWINGDLIPKDGHDRVAFAVLRAVMAHLYLAWIHPFGDGNGRTARLVEVQILLGAGVPTIAAHLLSNFYNQTRPEYYRQLSVASKAGGNPLGFLEYAAQGLADQLDRQIRHIRRHQWNVAWRDYVYGCFRNLDTPASRRQRGLALELGQDKHRKGVRRRAITVINGDLARAYAQKTEKTLTRDLNSLQKMGLISRGGGRVSANRAILSSFLPGRLEESHRR